MNTLTRQITAWKVDDILREHEILTGIWRTETYQHPIRRNSNPHPIVGVISITQALPPLRSLFCCASNLTNNAASRYQVDEVEGAAICCA
ncbi:Hypothetical predicted protein [Octopus vulgaris]|uniref:Uncharacterized protein n=1 Tax=Octopus vulgaris TaxID=6645 RepID=A0AA36BU37_OCTVU|nr:Hypothetical predicted protein [Octopus vulgaris]